MGIIHCYFLSEKHRAFLHLWADIYVASGGIRLIIIFTTVIFVCAEFHIVKDFWKTRIWWDVKFWENIDPF